MILKESQRGTRAYNDMTRGNGFKLKEISPQLCPWWLAFSMRTRLFMPLVKERARHPQIFQGTCAH